MAILLNPQKFMADIWNKFYLIKKDFKVNETPKVIQSKYIKIFKDSISAVEYMLKHNIDGQQFFSPPQKKMMEIFSNLLSLKKLPAP